jgi:hypothetical protein
VTDVSKGLVAMLEVSIALDGSDIRSASRADYDRIALVTPITQLLRLIAAADRDRAR